MKSEAELRGILQTLEAIKYRQEFRRFDYFQPYPKQRQFIDCGLNRRERLLMAANRTGKTEVGAYEAAIHATGLYPKDWKGKRFEGLTKGWVIGLTAQQVRDVCQTKLCGEPGVESKWGSGMIPKDCLIDSSRARGVTDVLDTVQVKHVSGGISIIRFKSCEQGREKLQGEGLDWIWFDEEPPEKIYAEGLTRIGERDGICWITFTPLNGPTTVVLRFTDEVSPDRALVGMTLDDIPPDGHLTAAAKKKMEEGYLVHEREARSKGIPMLGSGRIFTTPEENIIEPPIQHIPSYWAKIWGLDFGIGHPFAAVLLLWDKDNDVVHVHAAIRQVGTISLAHAAAMKRIAAGVPVAWPRDGADRDPNTGAPLMAAYKAHGLVMLPHHATWEDGSVSTEAGIHEWDEREKTGRLKVAEQLSEWLEERRFYHRKDGKIVKLRDDLLSATRVGLMAKRFARTVGLGPHGQRIPREPQLAQGLDFDLFAV